MVDMQRFAGKVALVTGGGGGIGRATVERLAGEGARVAVLDRNEATAASAAQGVQANGGAAVALAADVTDEAQVNRAVTEAEAALGAIDVLVNNAGGTLAETFEATDAALWRREIELNLTGPYLVARAVLVGMVARRSGAIVNVATVNALMTFGNPGYSAAKAGLLQLTQQLATVYGPHGIRTNAVLPGTIRTPAWDRRLAERPGLLDRLNKWYPVGRVGEPADIAAAIAYLASADAAFVNGACLVVDGGLTAGMGPMAREITGSDG